MNEKYFKRILKIIITFPFKFVVMVFCTIFLPLIWVFEDSLTFYEYFITWRAIFLEKEIPEFQKEYEDIIFKKGEQYGE